MPWEIPTKISLLAVGILFLFTFFNLILDAPRTLLPSNSVVVTWPQKKIGSILRQQLFLISSRSWSNKAPAGPSRGAARGWLKMLLMVTWQKDDVTSNNLFLLLAQLILKYVTRELKVRRGTTQLEQFIITFRGPFSVVRCSCWRSSNPGVGEKSDHATSLPTSHKKAQEKFWSHD